ncbi:cytochrome P450 [Planotetraspora sp. A-T 1434]|uniref:cytochrome P450 n=1 Tax=Planotetraspora sp. A-T 1434 TaxID=2979219 RepID=UPI0021C18625|nr:cytochrome P450 [Planotetraspora sp. A-T 1434]MCT9933262.1 cytochrome P450 [Planotetraspora sp. A-T 1434]
MNALATFARQAHGEIVRLNLGPFRPYLVSHPDHVQHVLRGNWRNYTRDGVFWRPTRRLTGEGIFSEASWESSRAVLQPLFTAKYIASLAGDLAETINEGISALDRHARSGRPVDAAEEMARVVAKAVIAVLFGNKISAADAERLGPAYDTAATSFSLRLLMPFLPDSVPVPGDWAFGGAVKVIDEVMLPVIGRARAEPDEGTDIVSALSRARVEDGSGVGDRQMRDDLVAMYAAAYETTGIALTWLWPLLDEHPQVARRLYDEVDRVVGVGPVTAECLPELRYTKMVLQELLRLYPSAWIVPRIVAEPDDIGQVRIPAGAQILLSPYTTHRLDEFWDRPLVFDPDRFAPEGDERRHRWSYIPFGGGPRQCLGQHLFYIEAPLIVASILSRFRPQLTSSGPYTPLPGATAHPRPRVEMRLLARENA